MKDLKEQMLETATTIKGVCGFIQSDSNIRFNLDVLPDDNLIKKFVEFYSELTEAPDEFLLTAIITDLGAMIGNKAWIEQSIAKIYPNIWSVIVGKTTAFRKSTALNLAKQMLAKVEFLEFYPQVVRGETLIEKLRDEPFGLFLYNEWKSFATSLEKRQQINLKALFTELYDTHCYQKIIKKIDPKKDENRLDKIEINDVAISMSIASTLEWLDFQNSDLISGFMPRFIFSTMTTNYKEPIAIPKDKSNSNLITDFGAIKRNIDERGGGELQLSNEAKKLYAGWYNNHYKATNKITNTTLPGFLRRLERYILKFAIILHLTSESSFRTNVITETTMQTAIHLQEYYRENIRYLVTEKFTVNTYRDAEKKVLDYLENNKITTRRQIQRSSNIFSHKGMGMFLDKIIENLIDDNVVEVVSVETKAGGSRKKCIKLL